MRKGDKMYRAKKDADKGVFGCKVIEDTPDGYVETNEYFVDSSGFGCEGEPALTPNQFLGKVKKGRYYAITGQGQFQVFVAEYEKN